MRPLVLSSSALAAAVLSGALVAGTSTRSPERVGPVTSPTAAFTADPTPGFFGGGLPSWGLPGVGDPGGGDSSTPIGSGVGRIPPPLLRQSTGLPFHEFYFTRAIYSDYRGGLRSFGRFRRGGSWSIDYPKADEQFMVMVDHLVNLDLFPYSNAVRLDDPAVRRFPFLYALEVGNMRLTEAEVHGLRDYLDAGGFLVIDDFWGTYEWENFLREISRVVPGREIVPLPMDHPVFHTFYDIDEILQVPNVGNGRSGGPTYERDGYTPYVLGIFDEHDRLMVIINWNTDLGDAWEWAEDPFYPLKFSRFAAEMGVNMIVYSMSH